MLLLGFIGKGADGPRRLRLREVWPTKNLCVSVFVCVCVPVCVPVRVRMCACAPVCACMCAYTPVCACVFVQVWSYVCLCMCLCGHMCSCMCLCVRMCACMPMCVYACVHALRVYAHMCPCLCTHVCVVCFLGTSVPMKGAYTLGVPLAGPSSASPPGGRRLWEPVPPPWGSGLAVLPGSPGGRIVSHGPASVARWGPSCVGCRHESPACTHPGSSCLLPMKTEGQHIQCGQCPPGEGDFPWSPPYRTSGPRD